MLVSLAALLQPTSKVYIFQCKWNFYVTHLRAIIFVWSASIDYSLNVIVIMQIEPKRIYSCWCKKYILQRSQIFIRR